MDNVREGIAKAFDKPVAIAYDFKKADVVLALDSDFLCLSPGTSRYSRDFAGRRKVRKDARDGVTPEEMNRLYAVECMPTSTGAFADHRLALSSAQIEAFARELANVLGVAGAPAAGPLPDGAKAWLAGMAKDLMTKDLKDRAKGTTLVVAGDHLPAHVHALVFAINNALGNIGSTVLQTTPFEFRPADKVIPLKQLTDEMAAKKVEVLLVFSSNPAYTAPADLAFADAAKNVRFKLHLGSHQDETAVLCEWHVPEAHYLETWGDIRGHDGTVTIQQPLIAPLYDGKSILEFLADVTLNKARHGLDLVKGFWRDRFNAAKVSGEFEIAWQESVRSGVVKGSAPAPAAVAALSPKWAENSPPSAAAPTEGQYEINFRPDPTLYDGRYANNGWLQELPKPLILICWDNAAYMSPATAAKTRRRPATTAGPPANTAAPRSASSSSPTRTRRSRCRPGASPATPTVPSRSTWATAARGRDASPPVPPNPTPRTNRSAVSTRTGCAPSDGALVGGGTRWSAAPTTPTSWPACRDAGRCCRRTRPRARS